MINEALCNCSLNIDIFGLYAIHIQLQMTTQIQFSKHILNETHFQ